TPNRIPEEPRTTIQGNPGSIQYAICNKCRRKGHTHKDCLSNECLTCGQSNHITARCSELYQCEHCHKKGHKRYQCKELALDKVNEHHACGCAVNEIISRRNSHLTNPDSLTSKNKKNYCCNCLIPLTRNNLTPL
ncbi:11329_t:CDS:2, partial [Cetraspora pellucida]